MQMDKSFEMQIGMGLQQDGESDELKRVLLEGNPILLVSGWVGREKGLQQQRQQLDGTAQQS